MSSIYQGFLSGRKSEARLSIVIGVYGRALTHSLRANDKGGKNLQRCVNIEYTPSGQIYLTLFLSFCVNLESISLLIDIN